VIQMKVMSKRTGRLPLQLVVLLSIGFVAPAMGQSLSDGVVGQWRLDQFLDDISCNDLDLQAVGAPSFATGLLGSSLDFPGTGSDYATRPGDDSILDFGTSDFTIQLWVRFDTTSGERVLIEKMTGDGTPPTTEGWTITKIPANSIRFGAATNVLNTPNLSLSTAVWYHIVVRRNSAGRSIWFNGTSVASDTNTDPVLDTTFPLLLGRRNASAGQGALALDGQLDEIVIWNRALADADIVNLYNSGNGRTVGPCIPTLSQWGVAVMGLLLLTAGTIVVRRRVTTAS